MRYVILLLGAMLLGNPSLAAQTPGEAITIPRLDRPPAIDDFVAHGANGSGAQNGNTSGVGARVTEFRQREPGDGVPASQPTTAYVSYDDANLYVVFVCKDEPGQVRASIAKREEIGSDDQVMLYLDTFHDRKRAYFFMANPRGIQLDGILTEGQDVDVDFDAVWYSEGRLTEDGYVVRMTIPFRSLRFPRTSSVSTWGIAVGRTIQRRGEDSYWPLLTKRVKGFVPQLAALQGLENISPSRNVQLNPYTMFARARVLDEGGPAFHTLGDERIGLDAKAVIRSALTLDATVNPDFSQVESDDPQVTVNQRFAVFFPEKRPFFIENTGYFETPVNLFYSRRIVDPGAGLRLTGKVGNWSVGAIGMNDREPAGATAGVGVVRVQRELGTESTVGAIVTDRELEGDAGRSFSLDSRLKLSKNWAFLSQVIRSEERVAGTRRIGFGGVAEVQRDGRHFDYASRYVHFDPDFTVPLGFVQRGGIRQTDHSFKYTFRPDGRAVLKYGPQIEASYVWDPAGRQIDRAIKGEFSVEFEGQTDVQVQHVDAFELFEGAPFRPYRTELKAGTEFLKWLSLQASYAWGAEVNHDAPVGVAPSLGRAAEAEVSMTLRPTPRLRWDQTYIHSRLNTAAGQRILTERLARTHVNYQFSRLLSLRAIVDYRAEGGDTTLADISDDRRWRADVLATYLLNPGTALYVGVTDTYKNLGLAGTPPTVQPRRRADMSTARQVFVKVSYLWRL